jgi:hypothetical protein
LARLKNATPPANDLSVLANRPVVDAGGARSARRAVGRAAGHGQAQDACPRERDSYGVGSMPNAKSNPTAR